MHNQRTTEHNRHAAAAPRGAPGGTAAVRWQGEAVDPAVTGGGRRGRPGFRFRSVADAFELRSEAISFNQN
jgi:hypothetical protein